MTTFILRELDGADAELTNHSFKSIFEAKNWVKDNTGYFEPNEIICIIDFKMKESTFCKLTLTVTLEDA